MDENTCKESIGQDNWVACQTPSLYKTFLTNPDPTSSVSASKEADVQQTTTTSDTGTTTAFDDASKEAEVTVGSSTSHFDSSALTATAHTAGTTGSPTPTPTLPVDTSTSANAGNASEAAGSPTSTPTPDVDPSASAGTPNTSGGTGSSNLSSFSFDPVYLKAGAGLASTIFCAVKAYKETRKLYEESRPRPLAANLFGAKEPAAKASKWRAIVYAGAAASSAVYTAYTLRA